MSHIEPLKEHRWLHKLIGDWTCTSKCATAPGAEPVLTHGRETVRTIGDLWIIAEGAGDTSDGGTVSYVMILGYDPQRERFVGSWVGSPMSQMFVYEGVLDDAGEILTLETTGPDFSDPTKTARYRDVIEIRGDDRALRSLLLDDDGNWQEFMHVPYSRA